MFIPHKSSFTVAQSRLDTQEVHAVVAGRRDAHRLNWDASLPQGRMRKLARRWLRRLTGLEEARPFASERLEALRLFACMLRRDDRRAFAVADRLQTLGLTQTALREAVGITLA